MRVWKFAAALRSPSGNAGRPPECGLAVAAMRVPLVRGPPLCAEWFIVVDTGGRRRGEAW